jgi:hypothetical protein
LPTIPHNFVSSQYTITMESGEESGAASGVRKMKGWKKNSMDCGEDE